MRQATTGQPGGHEETIRKPPLSRRTFPWKTTWTATRLCIDGQGLPAQPELLAGVVSAAPGDALAALVSVALLLFCGSRAFAAMTSAINVLWWGVDRLTFRAGSLLRLWMPAVTLSLLCGAALAGPGSGASPPPATG
jgi:hypothetical protein